MSKKPEGQQYKSEFDSRPKDPYQRVAEIIVRAKQNSPKPEQDLQNRDTTAESFVNVSYETTTRKGLLDSEIVTTSVSFYNDNDRDDGFEQDLTWQENGRIWIRIVTTTTSRDFPIRSFLSSLVMQDRFLAERNQYKHKSLQLTDMAISRSTKKVEGTDFHISTPRLEVRNPHTWSWAPADDSQESTLREVVQNLDKVVPPLSDKG